MEKEILNFAVISALIGIFTWVTKNLLDTNKDLLAKNKSTTEHFNESLSRIEKEKTLAIDTEQKKFQLELQKKDIELQKKDSEMEILKARYNALEENYKIEKEILSGMASQSLFDHLKKTKEDLESALEEVRQSLQQEGVEKEQLQQKLAELEKSIQAVSILDVSKIKKYEYRLKNDLIAANWLSEQSQSLTTLLSQSIPENFRELTEQFKKDIANLIDWLHRSLNDGDPQSDEVVITTNLPKINYENVIEELRRYSRQHLVKEVFEALDFYLEDLIKKIKAST